MGAIRGAWLGERAYALGLWCADGYWWSSSIGLANTDPELILRFAAVLQSAVGSDRLRVRVYAEPDWGIDDRILGLGRLSLCAPKKMRRPAYHVYVNSRPLLRDFRCAEAKVLELDDRAAGPYFAGRFDGDGAFGTKRVPGIRIAYSNHGEAATDAMLLRRMGIVAVSILKYSRINEHVIYIQKPAIGAFVQLVAAHSTRFDAKAKEASRRTPPKKSVPRKPHSEDVKAGEPRFKE